MNQDLKKGIEWLFNHCNTSYSLKDTIEVFELFFAAYEHFTEEKHPVINVGQIKDIIENMPFVCVGNCEDNTLDISVEDYKLMIPAYFMTNYKNCDYHINHFFSGKIRELKYYESHND